MHKQRRYVLTLYHLDEHWVVVAFTFEKGSVTYLDPLRRKKSYEQRDFKAVRTLFEEAWKKAVTEYELPSYGGKKITHHRNFPCIQQPQGTVFCGYYCVYIIRNWITNFKPKTKMTYQQMVDYFKTESEYGHNPPVLVFDIQREIATILNKEVLKENGDFYEGRVVPMY